MDINTCTFAPPFEDKSFLQLAVFMYSNNLIKAKAKANAKAFHFNNVRVKLVPWHGQEVHPITGIAFYVSSDGSYGLRVYPDGRKELVNATPTNKGYAYVHGKAEYLQFKQPWAPGAHILASHAVYLAWRNKPIPVGMTIDHIDGITTNNHFRNLRCVSGSINSRDGGFARKLRKNGINPAAVDRAFLLRYFDRMVLFKETHTLYRYRNLSKTDLMHILYDNDYRNDL